MKNNMQKNPTPTFDLCYRKTSIVLGTEESGFESIEAAKKAALKDPERFAGCGIYEVERWENNDNEMEIDWKLVVSPEDLWQPVENEDE